MFVPTVTVVLQQQQNPYPIDRYYKRDICPWQDKITYCNLQISCSWVEIQQDTEIISVCVTSQKVGWPPELRTPRRHSASRLEFKWGFLSGNQQRIISHQPSSPCSLPVILIVISPTIFHQSAPVHFLPASYQLGTTVRKMSCLRANRSPSFSGKEIPWSSAASAWKHSCKWVSKSSIKSLSPLLSVLSGKARPFIYICNLDM